MDADELDHYRDYYRDHVRRNPANIEARLRLATVFRELDDRKRAVEHFEVAAELLSEEEDYLDAIAACKAVLQLAPERRSAQYLLAHLYARTPEAFEHSPRVAQPLADREAEHEPDETQPRYRTERGALEDDTAVTPSPEAYEREEQGGDDTTFDDESEEDLRETVDWSPEEQRERIAEYEADSDPERETMSRDEMEDLLTTIDVEPSDVVDIEDVSDVDTFEEKYGSEPE